MSCMGRAEEQATKLVKLPDRVATVIGKTYAVRGDAWEIDDSQALGMIRDLLDEIDETLMDRNKDKRLIRR